MPGYTAISNLVHDDWPPAGAILAISAGLGDFFATYLIINMLARAVICRRDGCDDDKIAAHGSPRLFLLRLAVRHFLFLQDSARRRGTDNNASYCYLPATHTA